MHILTCVSYLINVWSLNKGLSSVNICKLIITYLGILLHFSLLYIRMGRYTWMQFIWERMNFGRRGERMFGRSAGPRLSLRGSWGRTAALLHQCRSHSLDNSTCKLVIVGSLSLAYFSDISHFDWLELFGLADFAVTNSNLNIYSAVMQ